MSMSASVITSVPVSLIRPGSVIEAVYWAVPGLYANVWTGEHMCAGTPQDSFGPAAAEAVEHAIAEIQATVEAHGHHKGISIVDQRVVIDLRWIVREPSGTSMDCVAERRMFDSPTDARAWVDRSRRLTGVASR